MTIQIQGKNYCKVHVKKSLKMIKSEINKCSTDFKNKCNL